MKKFFQKILTTIASVACAVAFFFWIAAQRERGQQYLGSLPSAPVEPARDLSILKAEFCTELVRIPGIHEARFISDDLLSVRFAPIIHNGEHHVRVLCEGLALTWAARARLNSVRVESRYGNEAYATGTFIADHPPSASQGRLPVPDDNGKLVYPPEPSEEDKIRAFALWGLTLAEVEQQHGKALTKHSSTGWAFWPRFKAHFINGRVDEYGPWTPVNPHVSTQ